MTKEAIRKRVEKECKANNYLNVKIKRIIAGLGIGYVDLEYDWDFNNKTHNMDTTWIALEHMGGNISFEY